MKRQFFTENKVVISHPFKSRIPTNSQLFDTNWIEDPFQLCSTIRKIACGKECHKYGKWNCKECLFPVKSKYLVQAEFNLNMLILYLIF